MARALADQGHLAQTLEQVRAKVKELRLGYVRATEGGGAGADTCPHYECLHAILGEMAVQGPYPTVDTGLRTPVVRMPDLEEEGDLTTGSEDEGEDRPITLHLKPVPSSRDVSWASSKASDGSSAGPARSEGPSSPAPATMTQGPGTQARQRDQLLQRHVQAVERMEEAVSTKTRADLEWWQQAWGQFLQRCDRMCDSISTLMSHIGYATHYGPPCRFPCCAHAPSCRPSCRAYALPLCCAYALPLHPILPISLCCLPQPGLKGAEASAPVDALGGAAPPSNKPPSLSHFRVPSSSPSQVRAPSHCPPFVPM